MSHVWVLAVFVYAATAGAVEFAAEEAAVAIRADDGRRPLILPKPIQLDSTQLKNGPAGAGNNCADPTGRTINTGGPFSETCKGPSVRY